MPDDPIPPSNESLVRTVGELALEVKALRKELDEIRLRVEAIDEDPGDVPTDDGDDELDL